MPYFVYLCGGYCRFYRIMPWRKCRHGRVRQSGGDVSMPGRARGITPPDRVTVRLKIAAIYGKAFITRLFLTTWNFATFR